MKTQENFLKEKLGLSENDKLELKKFNRITRNTNYILDVNGISMYFLKVNSEGRKKESEMFDFLKKYPLINTIMPLYKDEKLIVFPYIPGLKDCQVRDNLDFIVDFHNKSLKLPDNAYNHFNEDRLFKNYSIIKFLDRVNRHRSLVLNFWKDVDSLETFYNKYPNEDFNSLPKILVHGDIQHKNLQKDESGKIFLIDFEDVCYDSPSWDLSRALMDLEKNEIDEFKGKYVYSVDINNKKLLSLEIERNFVIRVITDAIGRQQRFGVENGRMFLEIYREKYGEKLEEIIYDKNLF